MPKVTIASLHKISVDHGRRLAALEKASVPATLAVTDALTPPPAQPGEVYAGIVFKDGKPEYHLFKRPEEAEGKTFDEALAFAGKAGEAPSRRDAALCWISIPDAFQKAWYWTAEQAADVPAYAWLQSFSNGLQYWDHKSSGSRVFAVRRVPIR